MRTLPSASVISSSEMFDSDTRSTKVFSLRKSINISSNAGLDARTVPIAP